jgi:hypothetical protein
MSCNTEIRTAHMSFDFVVCTDHGHSAPQGGMFEGGGVPPEDAVSGMLSVIEQIMAQFVAQHDDVREFLAREFDGEVLNERAQFRIMRLLAHAVLAQQVSARAYFVHGQSAMMSVPFKGGES